MEDITLVVSPHIAFVDEFARHYNNIAYAADVEGAHKAIQQGFPRWAFFDLSEWREDFEQLAAQLARWGTAVRCILTAYPEPGQLRVPLYEVRQQLMGCPMSPAEMKILRLLVQSKSNGAIARELFLSENTVKGHIRTMLRKAEVRDRAALAVKAFACRWV